MGIERGREGERERERERRKVAKRRRDSADGDDAVLPAVSLRRGQAVRLLDAGELPRGLQHVPREWHPLQPRVAASWTHLRDPEDHACRGAHRSRLAELPVPRQPRCQARLGPRARLRPGHVDDAAVR
eukprot:scaffold4161_cov218-Pinguiococcus_pyrenoidosus.AAC.6